MVQKITKPDCDRDLNLTKFMNDLVVDHWHKRSLTEFVSSIYKKGSGVPDTGFVCNCSCVCRSTHIKSA